MSPPRRFPKDRPGSNAGAAGGTAGVAYGYLAGDTTGDDGCGHPEPAPLQAFPILLTFMRPNVIPPFIRTISKITKPENFY
ncbi:MAG: hypothetical protein ACM3TR_18560 [Caulobacteraceae bacterium]